MGKREAGHDLDPEDDDGWGAYLASQRRKREDQEPPPPAEPPPLPTNNCPRCNSRQWVRTTTQPGEWKCYECPVKTNPNEVIAWCLIARPDNPVPPSNLQYAIDCTVIHPDKGGS